MSWPRSTASSPSLATRCTMARDIDIDSDPDTAVPAVTVTSIHHETLAEPMSFKDRARFRLSAPVSDLGSDVWANDALLDALDKAPDADALEAIVALRKMVGGGGDEEASDGDGDVRSPSSTDDDENAPDEPDHDEPAVAHAHVPPRPPRTGDDTLLPPPPRRSRSLPPPSMRVPHPLAAPPLTLPASPTPTVLTAVAKRTVSMAWTQIAKHMPPPPVPPVPPLHAIPLPRALPVPSGDFTAPPIAPVDLNVPPEPVVVLDDFTAPPLPPALPPPAPHPLRSPSLPPPPRRNSSVPSLPRARVTHRPAVAPASSESTIDAWLSDADSALVKLHAMLDAVERQVASDERARGRTWFGDGGGRWTRTTLPRRGAEGEGEEGGPASAPAGAA
ncbi:hypothetical protein AMAG_17149 [Allomyces macrogynus ATCC 38327]|uniref:Uncharacterized protein n=1 Tax=Allomyces macrogynus (strain ATCC 38327) TaxID=578462 RepID=A0A0L0TE05_ALLM3|nr:hypothetical protein AMAG_17149 [Allomyces macrogynus ATCC 38327]|eukprot:KNE72911.1 hypothetical protein AMAG_17149 [Allomyces macrogynus ATCC 38327]